MKDLFEEIRADKDFNLETLSYQEIFEGLKFGIANSISERTREDVDPESLELIVDRCHTRQAYGEDGNLYPKIYLHIKGFYSVLLNPFEIEIIETKYKVRDFSNYPLKEALYNFMCEKFPECKYEIVYEKYLINSNRIRRERENSLFI